MKATRVWFEGERIYIETDDGRILWQSILLLKIEECYG